MFSSKQLEEFLEEAHEIPYNIKFEGIDIFGGAVEHIKNAITSSDEKDVPTIMGEAVLIAIKFITIQRHSNGQGYVARDRLNRPIFIDDLDVASLVKYLPRRLGNFLKGFQAEYIVNGILQQREDIQVVADKELDDLIREKFSIEGDFSADKNHHIDMAIMHQEMLYLIHIFQEKSRDSVRKKIARYMSRKKITHILKYRHGITYWSLTDLTPEYVNNQVDLILEGDRSIKIKNDGTVQFNDF